MPFSEFSQIKKKKLFYFIFSCFEENSTTYVASCDGSGKLFSK